MSVAAPQPRPTGSNPPIPTPANRASLHHSQRPAYTAYHSPNAQHTTAHPSRAEHSPTAPDPPTTDHRVTGPRQTGGRGQTGQTGAGGADSGALAASSALRHAPRYSAAGARSLGGRSVGRTRMVKRGSRTVVGRSDSDGEAG